MKTRKMRNFRKAMVAGATAFLMFAESVTAFACPAEPHDETACACGEEHGAVVLYDEQFVDEEGNITPASGIEGRVFCPKHDIISGYFQTHIENDKGGCKVKTYKSTQCIICNTIWVGDLIQIDEFAKCPHSNVGK